MGSERIRGTKEKRKKRWTSLRYGEIRSQSLGRATSFCVRLLRGNRRAKLPRYDLNGRGKRRQLSRSTTFDIALRHLPSHLRVKRRPALPASTADTNPTHATVAVIVKICPLEWMNSKSTLFRSKHSVLTVSGTAYGARGN